jgi:hypothetical protein
MRRLWKKIDYNAKVTKGMPELPLWAIRRAGFAATAIFLIALTGLLADTAIDVWPALGAQSELCKKAENMPRSQRPEFLKLIKQAGKVNCKFGDLPVTRVNLGGTHTYLAADQAMLAIIAIFAGLGALVQSLKSVGLAIIGKEFDDLSLGWTLLRPFAAAALGLIAYVVLRTFFLPSGMLITANPYGFITVAALIGLFVDQVLEWLHFAGEKLKRNWT